MGIACPVDLDTLKLRAEIQTIYAWVATDPSGEFGTTVVDIGCGAGMDLFLFRGTSKEGVARKYGVAGVNVYASRGQH